MSPRIGQSILVGIPTTSGARMSVSWIEASSSMSMPLGTSWGRKWIIDEHIANARNMLVEAAFEIKADYLVFLGDDVLPPSNTILLMLNKIGRSFRCDGDKLVRADMITGVYWTKGYPTEPYLWNRPILSGPHRNWKAGEFFPVDLAGCDCLMIDMKAVADVPRPWFRTDWTWEEGTLPSPIATEDFYMYSLMRKHGKRLFADTSIQCLHEDRPTGAMFGITDDSIQAEGLPFTPDDAEMVIAEVGSGVWSPNYGAKTTVVRFDGRSEVKPDVQCDIREIPNLYWGKFDLVHASHVLEHFGRHEAIGVLSHWCKLLKPGGEMVIRVPNVEHAMRRIIDAIDHPGEGRSDTYDFAQLYGSQEGYETSFHKNGFVKPTLLNLFKRIPGMNDITVELSEEGLNLLARGKYTDPGFPALLDMWDDIDKAEVDLPEPNGIGEKEAVAW